MDELNVLGNLIRERRKALGMTQGQLAAKVQRQQVAVSEWERGLVVPSVDLKLLADALEVTVERLTSAIEAGFTSNDKVEQAIRQSVLPRSQSDALITIYRGLLRSPTS